MSRLCFTFQNLADRTWRAIADAHQAGLSYGEETITETNLLHLRRYHPYQVRVRAFSKQKEEPATGADWEWWIGGRGRWFGMRVQAKRIKYPGDDFGTLQTYRTASMKRLQIEVLVEQARIDNLNPAYCLYVSQPGSAGTYSRCCSRTTRRFLHGCLIGDAVAVRATGSNKLNDLARVCHPWHCLVCNCPCCPLSGAPAPSGGRLADAAFAVLRHSRMAGRELCRESFDGFEDIPWFKPRQRLPDYLEPLSVGEGGDETDGRLREIAEERGLSGFVILQEGKR